MRYAKLGGRDREEFDYSKLRGRIREKFGKYETLAEAMGMDPATLSLRLNNRRQWVGAEIVLACELLDIPLEDAHEYFFCRKCCEITA